MCLDPHIERVIRELDHLNDMSVRGLSGEHHAVRCKVITVVIVDLKTMSVALVNIFLGISTFQGRTSLDLTWIRAQTHGTALSKNCHLFFHKVNDQMLATRIELTGVSIL